MIVTALRTLKNFPKLLKAKKIYRVSFERYLSDGVPPVDAEKTLLLANWASGGTYPKAYSRSRVVSRSSQKSKGFVNEIFSGYVASDAVKSIEKEGYFVLPAQIDGGLISELSAFLAAGPAEPRDFKGFKPAGTVPDDSATTWWMSQETIMQSSAFRRLIREAFPGDVSGEYFGGDPMVMSVAMWKTFPSISGQSASAQQFHCDGDRPLFLKMFIYLDDVAVDNGPHVYVPNTHGRKPRWLLSGARLTDDQIRSRYPQSQWKVITGRKGTVFFADTQGFHKGLNVVNGSRSMLQINFAADRFGPVYPTIGAASEAPQDIRQIVRSNLRYFSELYTPG